MNFKVLATEYDEKGALTDISHSYTFTAPDVALEQYNKLNREYHLDVDGNKTNIKKYKVTYFVQSWKKIPDPAEFCKQFEM